MEQVVMISHNNFCRLRLENFIFNKKDIRSCYDFEFMGEMWNGEAVDQSHLLELETDPRTTKLVSIDLNALAAESIEKILFALGLDVQKGMKESKALNSFGQPQN